MYLVLFVLCIYVAYMNHEFKWKLKKTDDSNDDRKTKSKIFNIHLISRKSGKGKSFSHLEVDVVFDEPQGFVSDLRHLEVICRSEKIEIGQ